MSRTYRLTYNPWITQHVDQAEIRREVVRFAATVAAQTDGAAEIEVLPALGVADQVKAIAGGRSQIALMNLLGYVFARQMTKTVQSVALAQRIIDGQVGDTYFSQLYTRGKTAVRPSRAGGVASVPRERLKDLSIGFGVPYSTSNFLVPAYELRKFGFHPLSSFRRVEFFGGHDLVAKAVYEQRVDIGAGHDGAIVDLGNQYGYGDASTELIQLHRSDPIPSDPIAVNVETEEEVKILKDALIKGGASPEGKEALARFWGNVQGLSPAEPDTYEMLEKAVEKLGFSRTDLLPDAH